MAAVLASGPDAVLSHRSAAELWGLVGRSRRAPEVTRPEKHRVRPALVARQARLSNDETTALLGIPVTTAPRTILDLASLMDRSLVERALNEIEVRRLTDPLSVPAVLARHPGSRGAGLLRSILEDADALNGVTKRQLERRFRVALAHRGLPMPRFNVDLAVRGRHVEVDCLWRAERLIVELDGHAFHGTRRAFEADRDRDRILLAEGWRVLRITWRQLDRDQEAVLGDLRGLLCI